jgi:hypothetical protein
MAMPFGPIVWTCVLWVSSATAASDFPTELAGDSSWASEGSTLVDTGQFVPSPGEHEDRDGDGFSIAEGDCLDDSSDPDAVDVHPGAVELCEDLLDNDCNGLFNDGCENPTAYGSVQGGGCSVLTESPPHALILAMVFALVSGTVRRRGDA